MKKHLTKSQSALQSIALAWFTVVLTACGGTGEHVSVDTLVPLAQIGNHMVATVQVNGQDARFIIDTGASHVAVTEGFANRLNLPRQAAPVKGTGAGATYQAQPVLLHSLQVGHGREDHVTAFIIPAPEEFSLDGMIGNAFLEPYAIILDYQAKTLRLQTPDTFVAPAAAASVPIQLRGHLILAPAMVDGHEGLCRIDTGAGNAMTVMRPAADALGLRDHYVPQLRTLSGRSPGGDVYGDMVRLPEVRIGGHVLTQVVAELSLAQSGTFSESGLLCNVGHEVLSRFKLTIDYVGRRMYLEPTANGRNPFTYPRGGIAIGKESGVLKVLFILPGGPADEAGLKAGDQIERINGQAASEVTSESVAAMLRRPTGTELTFSIRRNAQTSTQHILALRDLL